MNVVPDTSVVIDSRVSATIEDGQFEGATICVPEAVVAELEAQANDGIDSGWDGSRNSSGWPTWPTTGSSNSATSGSGPTRSSGDTPPRARSTR